MTHKYIQFGKLFNDDKFMKYTNFSILILINLMCIGLMLYENFWYDEAYTIAMVRMPFKDIWVTTSQDVHPPLYYMLLRLFYIFPGMEQLLSVKIFSWIFYLGYLLLGIYVCRKHYNKKIEFFWLILSGFMAPMIVQSTSPRMYTIALFCVSAVIYISYLAIKTDKLLYWILFLILSGISMWLHTFCMIEMFVLYIVILCWGLAKKRYKTSLKVIICGVIVSVAYLPWLFTLCKQFARWAGWESGWSSHIEEFGLSSIKDWLAEWFSTIMDPSKIVIILCALVFFIAGISAVFYVKKTKDYISCLGILLTGIVLLLAVIVTIAIVPVFVGRYLFPLFGSIYLFLALGIDNIKWNWIKIILVCTIIGCGVYTYVQEVRLENPSGLNEYCAYIESNVKEDDIIVVDNYHLMMMTVYYPEQKYMVYGNKPPCLPFKDNGVFTDWSQLKQEDVVWYLSFNDFRCGNLDDKYEVEERKEIKFYYYDIVLEKYRKKE